MKKIFGYLLFVILLFGTVNIGVSAQEQNELNTWAAPQEYENSTTFKVEVKKGNTTSWEELFVYNVKVGEQEVGKRKNSSMVNFDFSGTVDVRVTYKKGTIQSYDIRPTSLDIDASQSGNTLTFSMVQNNTKTKKFVIRINDSWDSECLHIVTNQIEQDKPSLQAANVYVINPGQEIPLQLPYGKDTYYFKEGIHTLPSGMWVELDLQSNVTVGHFELFQTDFLDNYYAQKFVIEGKITREASYTLLYDGTGNQSLGVKQGILNANVRYIRLRLLGNDNPNGWRFSNAINEFKVFDAVTGVNVAKNKAIAGAILNYDKAVDGDISTSYACINGYGNAHSEETFFLSADNTKVYMEAGAIVRGAFGSEGRSNLSIRGRGILDSSVLDHTNVDFGEARTGSIWLNEGSNNSVEGITILDPTMWTVVMNFSNYPSVKGINIFGSTMNADGIHLSASQNGVINNVFIRTCDDNIVMYHYGPTSNHTIENNVLWADEAHIFLIGLGTREAADISNISISNIDVLMQQGVYDLDKFNGVFKIWANGENKISNITIDNVRIDSFREPSKSSIFQLRTDERFVGEKNGKIENVSLSNIFYNGTEEKASILLGVDSEHTIKNVTINNYYRNGNKVVNFESANIGLAKNFTDLFIEGNRIIIHDNYGKPIKVLEEKFDGETLNVAPINWTCSGGVTVQNITSNQNKSVRVSKETGQEAYALKELGSIEGIITIKSKIYLSDKNNWKSISVKNANGEELIQIGFDSGGNIYSCEGASYSPFMTYNTNQWYDIQIVIDTFNDQYDLYIDFLLVRDDFNLVRETDEVGQIQFTSGENAASVYYFDDVVVMKSFVILENDFNQDHLDTMPIGWDTAQGVGVKNFPSGINKSVKIDKAQGTTVSTGKQILDKSGVFVIDAKIYIENKTNWKSLLVRDVFGNELIQVGFDSGGNIYSFNGINYQPYMVYNTGQWYKIKLVINTYTDKFDLYINNNVINQGDSLVNSTEAIGRIDFTSGENSSGVYYFDDVRIVNLF